MKKIQVIVPWKEGLHLRPASRLVRLAKASKSVICLKVGEKVADARTLFALLLLCAVAGMVIHLEVDGEDEDVVLTSVAGIFDSDTFRNDSTQEDSTT